MMWHGCVSSLHGAVTVTTVSLSASRRARLRGGLRRHPPERTVPLQHRSLDCLKIRRNWTPVRSQWPWWPVDCPVRKYMNKKRSKTRRQPRRSIRFAEFKLSAKAVSHAFQSEELLCLGASALTPSFEWRTAARSSVEHTPLIAVYPEGCEDTPDNDSGLVFHDYCVCDPSTLGDLTKVLSKRKTLRNSPYWKKRTGFSTSKESSAALLLMRFSFNDQSQCRVRKPRLGSQRKAKHLYRISTLRGKRLKEEVLRHLSSLSPESKSLTKEVNGDDLLKLKCKSATSPGRNGVEAGRGAMVQDGHASEAQSAAHGRTSARKRTPKACDCCGPACKPLGAKGHRAEKAGHRGQGTGRRGRKKREVARETPSVAIEAGSEPAELNGVTGSESDPSADMEVEPPPSCLEPSANPLLDHHYCKTEPWNTDSEMEHSLARPQLPTGFSDEEITEHIHEFLEHFYVKYGSFIPLCESDVLDHLTTKLNTDFTDRESFIHAEVAKYQAGLACAPMHYFKVAYNKHTLTLEDLSTLDHQNWLNDQVINMYGELIMDAVNHKVHFFNSFFHKQLVAKGYEGVKRWTKKVDLFTKNLLLIPIHLEIHWSLITVDISKQQITFYDSQGITFKHAVDNILRYILAEAKEKQHATYQKGWKMIVNKSIPQQKNDSDCGVFVLEYCKCLALKEPLQFTQEDMPKVRKRIYKELCECKLKD